MGRKFRLSTHCKNEEIKKKGKQAQQKRQVIKEPEHGLCFNYNYIKTHDSESRGQEYVLQVEQSLAIGESRTEDLDVPQPDCDIPQNSPVQSDFSVLKPISHPSD